MKENLPFIFLIVGTIVMMVFLIGIIIFIIQYKSRIQLLRTELITQQLKNTEEISRTKQEIYEETLKKVSEELHDNISALLSLSAFYVQSTLLSYPNVSEEQLKSIEEIIVKVQLELRHINHTLLYEGSDNSNLVKNLNKEIDYINKLKITSVELLIVGNPCQLSKDKNLVIFRICQEALQNSLKHSRSSKIYITFNFTSNELVIDISDNGNGFVLENALANHGNGLRNMIARSNLISADLTINSSIGNGTTITIKIPLTDDRQKN